MVRWTSRAFRSSSGPDTGGLATVSNNAAVSAKSLRKMIGCVPVGRSVSPSSRSLMSSNSAEVSEIRSSMSKEITVTLVRTIDSSFVTVEFSAIFCSILRVTSASIVSAATPGHAQIATAVRAGKTGSFRFGIQKYAKTPQQTVATSSTQATCRCSTKNRAVLCVVAMTLSSLFPWLMGSLSWESPARSRRRRQGSHHGQ
ncbi:MAG TPA: hypothetical protein VK886_06910 [Vicinamibacterales bacterium]|nr:hypothetical protein [Vicinamibacterales bacterium]